ncbi:MAG: DNA repair exonuclease [Candidatus Micrarchaeales archaeon]|nr:DNA repair exonuclease [Candidatus Micrarchaeales archaeon]
MKLAIVSDLHIGYERFAEDAFRQAKDALEKASKMADAILIPGDVFDKRAPKPEVIAQAINIFRELSRKEWKARVVEFESKDPSNRMHTNVPIIAIPGTHERTSEGKENVLELLALAGLLVDASEARVVIENGGEKIAVFGLGGISEDRVKEVLTRINPAPLPGMFNVFMMHQSTFELLPFDENVIRFDDLPRGFDLYVDGHIHSRYEGIVHGKKFLIPGSTVLTQLKDGEQGKKGFIVFDTSNSSHRFIEIDSRPFFSINLKFEDATPKAVLERSDAEIEKVLSAGGDRPILKLHLEGTIAKGFTNTDMPLRSLSSKYSQRLMLEIDSSKLRSPDAEKEIEQIREGNIGGTSVKELGMGIFISKLKEQNFDSGINASRLFEILSSGNSKEKVLKEADELLSS